MERGAFTAAEFVDAWVHIQGLAEQADNDRLRATVVLMCWTVNPESDRDWRDFAPPAELIDVFAWDCYAHGTSAETYIEPWSAARACDRRRPRARRRLGDSRDRSPCRRSGCGAGPCRLAGDAWVASRPTRARCS